MPCRLLRHANRPAACRAAAPPAPENHAQNSELSYLCDGDCTQPIMNTKRPLSRHERTIIVSGILCIVLTLIVMQLWLLTATMNAWLGGDETIIWPAAAASSVC